MIHEERFYSYIVLIRRLKKIGIDLEFKGNIPWIYLDKVNGNKVKEKFASNHGFTIAFYPLKQNQKLEITDLGEVFKIIRKYK